MLLERPAVLITPSGSTRQKGVDLEDIQILRTTITILIEEVSFIHHHHNFNPGPASAAALLRQELAATSAAGAFDADSRGSDATAE